MLIQGLHLPDIIIHLLPDIIVHLLADITDNMAVHRADRPLPMIETAHQGGMDVPIDAIQVTTGIREEEERLATENKPGLFIRSRLSPH
jgi:hypothetical protein